jgi:hypothetical protein
MIQNIPSQLLLASLKLNEDAQEIKGGVSRTCQVEALFDRWNIR